MDSRSSTILEAVIDEFIKTGKPISSGELFDHYDFDIRPATIRLEFVKLTDDGYLEKSYFSAGRIPTDKGYRFFINRIHEDPEIDANTNNLVKELMGGFFAGDHFDFIEQLSESLHLLSIGYDISGKNIYKKGLYELLEYDDWDEVRDFVGVVKDFEKIDERLESTTLNLDGPKVFIGSNPFTKSNLLSIIIDKFRADGEEFAIALIGPKRMDYRTNLSYLREIKKALNKS